MKKASLSFSKSLVALSFVAVGGVAQAQIPVTDGAHIAVSVFNEVEQITKWVAQFQQLAQQIKQAEALFNSMNGARGMGTLFDNPGITTVLPPDWQNLISQIKSTAAYATNRAKYPTFSNKPATNNLYDVIASQESVMQDLYDKSTQRVQQIKQLMTEIDLASDPAAKMDLANRMANEQNAIQANMNLVNLLKTRQQQEVQAAGNAASKEFGCNEFKSTAC